MREHARVVVIGGGCVGAGILYGLVRQGWQDVVLLERNRLDTETPWHAAGIIPTYDLNRNIGRMLGKGIAIYEELAAETGMDIGWHKCGQLRVANTPDRWDEYLNYMDMHETQGLRARLVGPEEIHELVPLIAPRGEDIIGGILHPDDGHIDPVRISAALFAAASGRGASIHDDTEVQAITRTRSGEWRVTTSRGEITCEHLICATGNHAHQTGAMLGLELPTLPILQQYCITEPVAEIVERRREGRPEMPILRMEWFEGYLREEGDGLLFGPYERKEDLRVFTGGERAEWTGGALEDEHYAVAAWNWETAQELVPTLAQTRIITNVRGPIQTTPDALPLMGKAPGLENVWLAEGVPGGTMWGGAIGHYLAQQITQGGTDIDTSDLDPRRFGTQANLNWTRERVIEAWGTHAMQHYPNEQPLAARPQKTSPTYDVLDHHGAVWGVLNGWEVPLWYARKGIARQTHDSWRWTEKRRSISEEVRTVRNTAGLVEMSCMTKFELSGPGAAAWLDDILANRLPGIGRARLCHHLTPRGTVLAEYVVARLAADLFYLISTPRAELVNLDELSRHLPQDGTVILHNTTNERGAFTLVGPRSRRILETLTRIDLSDEALPWMGVTSGTVGMASDVRILRLNYEGELGYELYAPLPLMRSLFEQILAAGERKGLGLIGLDAMETLRLEKSYRAMYRDMNTELTALESGLERFIAFDKGPFIGREALLVQRDEGLRRRSVTLKIETEGASVFCHEALYQGGRMVGRITSGSFSHTFGHDLALAIVESEYASPGQRFDLTILGQPHQAEVIPDSPYDPGARRSRG